MKIKKIHIVNFRQYMDIELDFPKANNYDLNYILAENGIGKTTLLNAITWCLYSKELHSTEGLKDKTLPLLTQKTWMEMEEQSEATTSVEITLEDSNEEITFERYAIFRKAPRENKPYEKTKGQKVTIISKVGSHEVLTDENEFVSEVNKRLPNKIQQFFFFDGEQLDTYLASTAGKSVEQAVLQISQIDLLVTMEKNLQTIIKELRTEASSKNSKTQQLNEKYELYKATREKVFEQLKDSLEEYEKAKIEKSNIDAELGDDPDIADLERTRDDIDNNIKELKKELISNNEDIKTFIKKYLILLSALPRIKSMYDQIKLKEENNELPPKYDKDELTQMLTEHRCHICNRDLDTDSTIYLANLIQRFELGQETGTLLTRMIGSLQSQIQEASKYEKERDRLFKENDRLQNEIAKATQSLNDLDKKINKYTNKEQIINLYQHRSDLEDYISKKYEEIIKQRVTLENVTKAENEIKEDLDFSIRKDKKCKQIRIQSELAESARKKIESIIIDIKADIRDKISEEMKSKFFELMWKKQFNNVEITENYSASVINDKGFECLGSCSAAERELLVLAFTLALHKESGFDGPLVIDTPLSRISGDLRVSFANVLKSVSAKKQIILFITRDEYSTNVKDVFEPSANRKYKFNLVNEEYLEAGVL